MSTKIDITSTTIEKGIDIVKDFVERFIIPTVEETGLLLKDKITEFRFRRQLRMLQRTKYFCEKNNIKLKTISLKLLCPLLDYSGLEEDDIMLDKWAILLSNMVDSEQNLENNVFPHVLSQLSTKEFEVLEKSYDARQEYLIPIIEEYRIFLNQRGDEIKVLKSDISSLESKIEGHKIGLTKVSDKEVIKWLEEVYYKNIDLNELTRKENDYKSTILRPINISKDSLTEFELSNLIRLGVVKEEKDFYADSPPLEIYNNLEDSYLRADVNIYVNSHVQYVITELGKIFIKACKEKHKN